MDVFHAHRGGVLNALVDRGNSYIAKFLPMVAILLCGITVINVTNDRTLPIRNIIWCMSAIILVLCTKEMKVHFFALGYLLFVIISGVFAINKSEWFYVVICTLLFVIYLSVVKIDERLLAKTMIVLGCVYFIYFWIDYSQMLDFNLCRGLMRQKNIWAMSHFFILPFCYYAFKERFWRKTAIFIAVMMCVNIVLLNCRSVLLATATAGVILIVRDKQLRWYLLVLFVSSICIGLWTNHEKMLDTETMRQRLVQWQPTLGMIFDNQLGVGAGNFWIEFPHYAPDIDYPKGHDKEVFLFPHNDFLWVWSETGPGVICFVGMFVMGLRRKTYIILFLAGFMVIAFFGGPKARMFPMFMLATILSMTPVKHTIEVRTVCLHILLCAMIVFGFRYRAAVWDNKLTGQLDWRQVEEFTKGYSIFSTMTYTGFPWHFHRAMANLHLKNYGLASRQMRKAYKYNPYNIHVLHGMGLISGNEGDIRGAGQYFQEALVICPEYEKANDSLDKLKKLIKDSKL